MHYHIIGTAHYLQEVGSKEEGLRNKIQAAYDRFPVVLIAEEVDANKEVLTFGQEIIGRDRWLSIDMPDEDRKAAGIYEILRKPPRIESYPGGDYPVDPYFYHAEGIREHFWLNQIWGWCTKNNDLDGTVLITCGHNHLPFLAGKAIARNHSVSLEECLPCVKSQVYGAFIVYE